MATQTAALVGVPTIGGEETAAIIADRVALPHASERRPALLHAAGEPSRRALAARAANRRGLFVADAVAAAIAVQVAAIAGGVGIRPACVLLVVFVAVVSKLNGLYERDEHLLHKSTLDEAPRLFWQSSLVALVVSLLQPQLFDAPLGRTGVVLIWGLLLALLLVLRAVSRAVVSRFAPEERLVVVGAPDACATLVTKLQRHERGLHVAHTIPLQPGTSGRRDTDDREHGWPLSDMRRLVLDHDLDRMLIAPSGSDGAEMLGLIRVAEAAGLSVTVVPRLFEVMGPAVEFDHLDGTTLLGIRRFALSRSSQRVKRVVDFLFAAVVITLLLPVLSLFALLIKADSRGPVFFRQSRVGRGGREFRIWKFRTMVPDAEARKATLRSDNEAVGLFKMVDDPRITRVGRWLRRTSLDELPQLFNVLTGDMSLVGPRPLIAEEDRLVEGHGRRRLHLTPGMTGHWQVLGSARIPLQEMAEIDYLYVTTWSIWTDIKILLRTVPFVVRRQGL